MRTDVSSLSVSFVDVGSVPTAWTLIPSSCLGNAVKVNSGSPSRLRDHITVHRNYSNRNTLSAGHSPGITPRLVGPYFCTFCPLAVLCDDGLSRRSFCGDSSVRGVREVLITAGSELLLRPRAKRRLELEAGDLQDPKDGGRTTKAKKPMASLTPTGGKPPAPSSVARKSLFERSRCDTSLGLLTQGFAELLNRSTDGVLDLNVVAQELNAPKRRVYDVTNVLEGVKLLKKKSKNTIQWLGGQETNASEELKNLTEEEKYLDELIQSCTRQIHQLCDDCYSQRYAYLTYEDVNRISSLKEQTVIVIKAPAETKLEVPHPEESLQVHLRSTQGPIEVFLCSDDPIPMEVTDSSAASDANGSHFNSTTSGKDSAPPSSLSSFTQVSSKDVANNSCRINNSSNPLSEQTQHSSPVPFTTVSPTPTSPSPEDQHSFVTLTPPLALSHDEEQYLLSLAEDVGITDLFSSVDLDQSPVEMPLV